MNDSWGQYTRDHDLDKEGDTHAAEWSEEDQREQDERIAREARHVDLVEFCRSLLLRPDREQ